jgi:hypothetical protein
MAAINGKAMYSVDFAFWTLTDNRRHVTSWKVASTIPDEVTEHFQFHYGSGFDSAYNRYEYQESSYNRYECEESSWAVKRGRCTAIC